MSTMLKFLLFAATLIGLGIVLTLSLPDYKVGSGNPAPKNQYSVDADSIMEPQPISSYFLPSPTPPDAQFALRLGLYSQLQQATDYAQNLELENTSPLIVKATDPHRDWYLVLLGPFADIASAREKRTWLQNEQISATLVLWPASEEADDTQ